MKEKTIESVKKLMNAELKPWQVHIYFNMYMVKSVFFGCGVMSLICEECEELKKIYEVPMLKKLHLAEKFPRKIMHVEKSVLGLGLMSLKTTLAIQNMKLCVGNTRAKTNVCDMIEAVQQYVQIYSGRSIDVMQITRNERNWFHTWIDNVAENAAERNISLLNFQPIEILKRNKTIMDFASEYVRDK